MDSRVPLVSVMGTRFGSIYGFALTLGLVGLAATVGAPNQSGATTLNLLGESPAEFERNWIERGFPFIAPTDYTVEASAAGEVVVKGLSDAGNRSRYRKLKIDYPASAKLTWRWKVGSTLQGVPAERTKGGDDFAARVFVVFEDSWIPTRIRAINYVWAAREPIGTQFNSPYSKNVHNIVLRTSSDDPASGTWVEEERDVWADYVACFGEAPSILNAVAIMVDTDNAKRTATAWFANLIMEINPPPRDSTSP
jgi:hypothetical protein